MSFDESKHIAFEGQKFRIEWYVDWSGESEALQYSEEMPKSHKAKLVQLFKVMGDFGQIRNKTKFRNEGDKIYAFKPQPYRFLCFFTVGQKIVITNGGAMLFLVEILQDSPRFLSSKMPSIQRFPVTSTSETFSIFVSSISDSLFNRWSIIS